MPGTSDLHVRSNLPLPSPAELAADIPAAGQLTDFVARCRHGPYKIWVALRCHGDREYS